MNTTPAPDIWALANGRWHWLNDNLEARCGAELADTTAIRDVHPGDHEGVGQHRRHLEAQRELANARNLLERGA